MVGLLIKCVEMINTVVGLLIQFRRTIFIEICKGSINHKRMLVNVAYLIRNEHFYLIA